MKHEVNEASKTAATRKLSCKRGNIATTLYYSRCKECVTVTARRRYKKMPTHDVENT